MNKGVHMFLLNMDQVRADVLNEEKCMNVRYKYDFTVKRNNRIRPEFSTLLLTSPPLVEVIFNHALKITFTVRCGSNNNTVGTTLTKPHHKSNTFSRVWW